MAKKQSKTKNTNLPQKNISDYSETLIVSGQLNVGPLPSPETLRGYDTTVKGSAERIIRMSEEYAEHQQSMEKNSLSAYTKENLIRLFLATFTVLACLGVSAFSIYMGSQIAGSIIGGTTIVGVIVAFLKTNST